MPAEQKPLWVCPRCGHRFVSRNIWHSCGQYDLADHFEGKNPQLKALFDQLVAAAQDCGPVTVYAQKTRIVFMVRVRFGGVITRKNWLYFSLWLTRRVEHPQLHKVEVFGPRSFGLRFRLGHPDEIDDALRALICEAYAVGRQEHLAS